MNKKTRLVLLTFLGTLIIAILSLNATYSFMKIKGSGENNTEVDVNSCAKILLNDQGNTINLTNMYPMDDEMGLQTTPYKFTISSTCDNYVGFNLYLTTFNDNEIDDNFIKFAITSKNDTVLVSNLLTSTTNGLNDFNETEKAQLGNGVTEGYKSIYKVYTNNIPLKGESEYKLYIWLDSSLDDSYEKNITMGKHISIGVSVKSFDREESMAEYLIKNKDESLIYHDGTIKDGEGNVIDAQDYSYRYSGGNSIVNNYICFGSDNCAGTDELYRIIGLFKNDLNLYEMKIIKATPATTTQLGEDGAYYGSDNKYYWNSTDSDHLTKEDNTNVNMWKNSNLNKVNLNGTFYDGIDSKYQGMVENHEWQVGGFSSGIKAKTVYDSELGANKVKESDKYCYNQGNNETTRLCDEENDLTYKANVGLMYMSDYAYGTSKENWTNLENAKNNNWLSLGFYEWTISRHFGYSYISWYLYDTSIAYGYYYVYEGFGVRPTMYLKSNVKKASTSGNGTSTSPYIITQ